MAQAKRRKHHEGMQQIVRASARAQRCAPDLDSTAAVCLQRLGRGYRVSYGSPEAVSEGAALAIRHPSAGVS